QFRRLLGPAKGREGPERRREPGVEHVFVADKWHRTAIMAFGLRRSLALLRRDKDRAVRAVPRRYLMAPPELARDAPGLDVLHPVEIGLFPMLRHELGPPGPHRLDRRPGQDLGVDIPLVGEERLDRNTAPVEPFLTDQ